METILVQPKNNEELKVVKDILKALKVGYKLKKEKTYNADFIAKIDNDEVLEENLLNNIKTGLKEVKLFKKGKLKTTSAADF